MAKIYLSQILEEKVILSLLFPSRSHLQCFQQDHHHLLSSCCLHQNKYLPHQQTIIFIIIFVFIQKNYWKWKRFIFLSFEQDSQVSVLKLLREFSSNTSSSHRSSVWSSWSMIHQSPSASKSYKIIHTDLSVSSSRTSVSTMCLETLFCQGDWRFSMSFTVAFLIFSCLSSRYNCFDWDTS